MAECCNSCISCWNYESYLDEMENILRAKGVLSTQYIIQLKHLYRSFMCKYKVGDYISSELGNIYARVDQYRLVREDGHIKVYLLDESGNLTDYLVEDLAKIITPESDEDRLIAFYNAYMTDHYKMMTFMNKIHNEELDFNNCLMKVYPPGTEVGVYLGKVEILDYIGENYGVVKMRNVVTDEIVCMTTSDFYMGMIDYKSNFKDVLVGGNY